VPLALIVCATVLAHAGFNGSRLTISLNALALGASPLVVGTMMSLFAALPMILGVPAGRLVDRIGVRAPILGAGGFLVLSVALAGVLPGIASLYVAAACVGTSFMMFHICVQHAVGEGSSEEDRKTNFGWLALGFSISNFFGPTTAGVAIDTFGYRPTFLLLASLALTSFLLLAWHRRVFTHTPNASARGERGSTFELLRNPELRRVFLVTGVLASAWDLFVFVMPIYGTSIGLSASTIGFILGSFAFATFLIRVFLPWIQRRLREWTMITSTMGIACVAYFLFPVMETVPLLAATAFLLGLGLGATQPSIMSLLYAKAPPGRAAEAVGVRTVVLNASHTVLPLAFGGVGAALGMTPVFLTMSGALAAGGILANRRRALEGGAR
jgi:predicted MFS family arabinose efflux permease